MMLHASFVAIVLATLTAVKAQDGGLPDISTLPAACATSCASTIETATLCSQEYGNVSSTIAACFCSGIPSSSDLSSCSDCLNENSSSTLGASLAALPQYCEQAAQSCAFECSFDTCESSDIGCQCGEEYLQNIFNCASCNTRNNNAGQTMVTDYNELRDSCRSQNYTSIPESTQSLPSPTGQASYTAPTLTATGGAVISSAAGSSSRAVSASTSRPASSIQSVASSIRSGANSATSATGSNTASRTGTGAVSGATGSPATTSAPVNSANRVRGGAIGGLVVMFVIAALI